MKLMLEFKYQWEVEIKGEEINIAKHNLKGDKFIPYLLSVLNKQFLIRDGRDEQGRVVDFDYKLED